MMLRKLKDGTIVMVPPPGWVLQLLQLVDDGVISMNQTGEVYQHWCDDILKGLKK